jgi:hypothetical protein
MSSAVRDESDRRDILPCRGSTTTRAKLALAFELQDGFSTTVGIDPSSGAQTLETGVSDRPKRTTCMVCLVRTARYYGSWAEEGLCRVCVLGMEPEIRIKVLRDMHSADRLRWQVDNKF